MAEDKDYGRKVDYDPVWPGPISEQRKPTDIWCLILLIIFCLLWLSMAVYVVPEGVYMEFFLRAGSSSIIFLYVALPALLCTAFIVLLRWFAKVVVYLFIALFLVAIVAVPCVLVEKLYSGEDKLVYVVCTAVAAIVVFLIAVAVLIVYRKKFQIACEIMKVASSCVIFFPTSFVISLLALVAFYVILTFAFAVYIGLIMITDSYGLTKWMFIVLNLINLLGLLWLGNILTGYLRMSLSGTFATWYWTRDKTDIPFFTLARCMKTTIIYHVGTLAFGSMIVDVCTSIRVLLSILKKRSGNGYYLCCAPLEGIVKYISCIAYTMGAIYGTDLLRSAKDTFNLFMRNPMKVTVISNVTEVMLIVAQVLIVGVTLFIANFWDPIKLSIEDISLPLVILTTIFYFVVLSAAIDTVFICVLEDFERNDGSSERPYHMNLKLKKLLFQDSNLPLKP